MARRKVEVRQEEILAATLDQIERLGLAQTRVGDVAQALGCSTALVFYHFGTKDELLAAAFGHAVEQDLAKLDRALARGADPTDRLRRVLRLYGPTGAARGWRLWIDAWALAQREPTIRAVLRSLDRRWTAALRSVVDEGVAAGDFRCRRQRGRGRPDRRPAGRAVGRHLGLPLGEPGGAARLDPAVRRG